jgi:lipid-A-disaccharide synthase
MTTVLLSAGDASGDPYAADLVTALRARRPDLRFLALAGDETRAAGADLVVHQREIAVGGLFELAGSASRIIASWRALSRTISRERPALAILIDTADFNIPLARKLSRAGVPVLYYVLPQVWAWRRGRIRKLARRSDGRAVIFPFEVAEYAREGVDVEFVGHPLVERVRNFGAIEAGEVLRDEIALPKGAPLLALLPGSRRNEIAYQLPLQLSVARALAKRFPKLRCVLPLAPSLEEVAVRESLEEAAGELPPVTLLRGRAWDALSAADVAIAKPGTVTLEAALLGCPLVVAGRGHALTAAILRRLVEVPAWAMPNLIAGEPFIPEFLQEEARPDAIAAALAALLVDGERRAGQLAGLAQVREQLGEGTPTARVCEMAEALLGAARTQS